jgi:hypothetical protein
VKFEVRYHKDKGWVIKIVNWMKTYGNTKKRVVAEINRSHAQVAGMKRVSDLHLGIDSDK